MAGESTVVQIDGRRLTVSNLDKVLFPETGTTKAEVLRYYALVAPALLPVMAGRPVTRKRWPHGVDSEPFFVKNVEPGAPRWIPRQLVAHTDRPIEYPLADSAAVLAWMAQMAALELHVPQWRFSEHRPGRPDRMVFDLDPGPGVGLAECARVAVWVRKVLQQAGSDAVPVTSGSKGLHLYVALDGERTSEEVSATAKAVAQSLEAEHAALVTSKMAKSGRPGKVFIDWSQNSAAKTTIAPYSLRGREHPTVAAPRNWQEVEGAELEHLEFHQVLDRLADGIDPWRDFFAGYANVGEPDPPSDLPDREVADAGGQRSDPDAVPGSDGGAYPGVVSPPASTPATAATPAAPSDDARAGAAAYAIAAMGGAERHHAAHRWEDPLEGPRGRVVRKEISRPDPAAAGSAAGRTRLSGGRAGSDLAPMLATAGEPGQITDGGMWRFEGKWDGIRALAEVTDGSVRLIGRSGRDLTAGYPELADIGRFVGDHAVVLDGEIVALDPDGRTSFSLLQQRMNLASVSLIHRAMGRVPVRYFAFDLLQIDGISVLGKTYDDRRRLLEALDPAGDTVEVPAPIEGDVQQALRYSRELNWEGIVAKRRDSLYRPGIRSGHWLKIKNQHTQEVVIVGWRPGAGRRSGGIGSLLVAVPGEDGLTYAGRVGTGFTDKALDDLKRLLEPTDLCHATGVPKADARDAIWVKPVVVGEVIFGEWTPDHRLRAPSWRGVRADKSAAEVRLES